jgi:ribosomal protein S18 acetylase RimI-like enzyme
MAKTIFVRDLRDTDVNAITDIEDRTTGVHRNEYWTERISLSEAIRPHWSSLVAEVDNRVVGFVFGRAGELEFALPGTIAWIEIIGVDPIYRHLGVASELVKKFSESAADHGIKKIFTLVNKKNQDMEHFFTTLGFTQGEMLHFQMENKA